jgi:hypothetical protein
MWRFVKDYWILLIFAIAAVSLFWHYRYDPLRAQTIGALFGFLTSLLLVWVTWEYVRTNQANLNLLQKQWEEQNRIVVQFGLRKSERKPRVWVSNLGLCNFMITKLIVRMPGEAPVYVNKHQSVRAGHVRGFFLPDHIWNKRLIRDLDIAILCVSNGEPVHTPSKMFSLLIDNDQVIKVYKGFRSSWYTNCPKCRESVPMRTDGLVNFDEAQLRNKEIDRNLEASCPNHISQWILTVEIQRRINASNSDEEE